MHHHYLGLVNEARDRRDVADKIEAKLLVERRVDRDRRADREQGVAVGGRAHDRLGGDVGGGTDPVVNHERLPQTLRQPVTDQSRQDVLRAARSRADDDAHQARRVGLRRHDPRHGRQRGSARGQMQKSSAGKFYFKSSLKAVTLP
jgi:hypothetical protein